MIKLARYLVKNVQNRLSKIKDYYFNIMFNTDKYSHKNIHNIGYNLPIANRTVGTAKDNSLNVCHAFSEQRYNLNVSYDIIHS